jgi:hypothetical protein
MNAKGRVMLLVGVLAGYLRDYSYAKNHRANTILKRRPR